MSTNYNQNRSCNCEHEYTTYNNGCNTSYEYNRRDTRSNCDETQKHVHELLGSTQVEEASCDCDAHNHRFALVTGEAERTSNGRSHVHKVEITTDFYDEHYHEFCGYTDEAIEVGCGRHVHLISDTTERSNQHDHDFLAVTLIENPIEDTRK